MFQRLGSLNLCEDVAASLVLSVAAATSPVTSGRCCRRNFGKCIIIVVLKRYKNSRGARRAFRWICVTLCHTHTHDPQPECFATRDGHRDDYCGSRPQRAPDKLLRDARQQRNGVSHTVHKLCFAFVNFSTQTEQSNSENVSFCMPGRACQDVSVVLCASPRARGQHLAIHEQTCDA